MKGHKENSGSSMAVTLADNSWRLSEFRTRTVVTEQFGKKIIRKIAITKEAGEFLKAVTTRERANAEYLKEHFDVLCGSLESDHIEYEYLPFQSLNQKIGAELRKNRYDKANELVILYVQKVHALDKLHICPKKFLSMVTQNTVQKCEFKVDCLSRGLLDLTPRNILVDGSRWIVVDNEWSFDFPIPVVFVLFRAIKETVTELQHEICRCMNRTHPAVGIFARGLRTYYFPEEWVKYLADAHISLAQMLRWEMGFQRYITGYNGGTVGRIKMNPKTKIHFQALHGSSNTMLTGRVTHFLKKLPAICQLVYLFERMLLSLKK